MLILTMHNIYCLYILFFYVVQFKSPKCRTALSHLCTNITLKVGQNSTSNHQSYQHTLITTETLNSRKNIIRNQSKLLIIMLQFCIFSQQLKIYITFIGKVNHVDHMAICFI